MNVRPAVLGGVERQDGLLDAGTQDGDAAGLERFDAHVGISADVGCRDQQEHG